MPLILLLPIILLIIVSSILFVFGWAKDQKWDPELLVGCEGYSYTDVSCEEEGVAVIFYGAERHSVRIKSYTRNAKPLTKILIIDYIKEKNLYMVEPY